MGATLRHLQNRVEVGDCLARDDVLARDEADRWVETDFSDRHDAMMRGWDGAHKAAAATRGRGVDREKVAMYGNGMAYYLYFEQEYPEVLETRTVGLVAGDRLLKTYSLLELYCGDPSCDCELARFHVACDETEQAAVITYDLRDEPEETLDGRNPRLRTAKALLQDLDNY